MWFNRRGAAHQQKPGEVGGDWFSTKLPHHQRNLTAMISGMVRHVLHQVREAEVCCANRKHLSQRFVCDAIHKLHLFSLDLGPRQLHRNDVRVCFRIEGNADSRPQIRDERGSESRLLPNR
jgi:hypothetical protein